MLNQACSDLLGGFYELSRGNRKSKGGKDPALDPAVIFEFDMRRQYQLPPEKDSVRNHLKGYVQII